MRGVDLVNATVSARGLMVARDIAYGAGPRRRMDVWRADGAEGPRPVAVWFYGGAWQWGERRDYRFAAAALARAGFVAVVPDYRLHPEVSFPDFIADGAAAVAHARAQAAAWGGDPARVFAIGHSAGAYIAAMLALDAGWGVRDWLAGAVGLAGPYDFLPMRDADIRAVFAPATDPRRTQPIHHVDGRNAPLLLLHGTRDRTCYPRNTLALASRIRAAGGEAQARLYPHVGHIGIVLTLLPWWRWRAPVLADLAAFAARTCPAQAGRAIQPAR